MKKFLYYFLYVFLIWWVMLLIYPSKFVNKKKKHQKGAQKIYICNHLHLMDLFYLIFHYPIRAMIFGKKEIEKTFVRHFIGIFNGITVERGTADLRAVRRVLGGLKNGESLILFPEGTRNRKDDGELKELKNGAVMFAIKTKTPLAPVLLHHIARPFRRNYMYCGEEFELSEFYDKPLNSETMREAGEVLTAHMKQENENMNAIMQEKYGKKKWYKRMMERREMEKVA